MEATNDRLINVPISDEDLVKTVQSLPRTPNSAGLIGVSLKRKQEFKNTHKQQLINPERIFRFLDKMKHNMNPFYTDIDTFETYRKKCFETDKAGFHLVFGENEDVDEEDEIVINELR